MKLLLASSGFTNETIIKAFEKLVGKSRAEINFAIINEAIKVESGDHHWFIESLNEIAHNFGGNIEFIDIQANKLDYVESRIAEADAIFCFGGNADYLTKVCEKTGFSKILPKILSEKVWVGSSAGSCVLCHKESREFAEDVFEEQPMYNHYLDLIPICFLPHFHGWFTRLTPEVTKRESENTNLPVFLMSDQSALMITGASDSIKIEPIGEDYLIFQKGEQINEPLSPTDAIINVAAPAPLISQITSSAENSLWCT